MAIVLSGDEQEKAAEDSLKAYLAASDVAGYVLSAIIASVCRIKLIPHSLDFCTFNLPSKP